MLRFKLTIVSAIAAAAISGAGLQEAMAQTPQASPQSYGGYASPQAPPGPVATACQPTGCQNVRYACNVTVCPCPCQTNYNCQEILSKIPAIHTPPTCQEAQVCTIIDEGPPTAPPVCIPIYRNCYVPIKIVTQPGPGPNVITPVNIQVNWREVHVLCDSKGVPIPGPKASEIIKQLSEQMANGEVSKDGAAVLSASAPAQVVNSAPTAPTQAQPAAPAPGAAIQTNTPAPSAPADRDPSDRCAQAVGVAGPGRCVRLRLSADRRALGDRCRQSPDGAPVMRKVVTCPRLPIPAPCTRFRWAGIAGTSNAIRICGIQHHRAQVLGTLIWAATARRLAD